MTQPRAAEAPLGGERTDPLPELPVRVITRGPISNLLARIPGSPRDPAVQRLRQAVVVEAHVAARAGDDVGGVTEDGHPFTVTKVLNRLMPNGSRVLHVEVETDGLPPDANPFLFVNPPIVGRDGREDVRQAYWEMVGQAVASARKRVS